MIFQPLPLDGAYQIDVEPFADSRGKFARIFCAEEFASIGHTNPFVQSNISVTRQKGAVRGMHFQRPPHAEIKVIRCIRGTVFDVIVDLRKGSETFLQWCSVELSSTRMNACYVPEGFAHGFQTLEPDCELLYMHTAFYTPDFEGGIRFDDQAVGIQWPLAPKDASDRDRNHPLIDNKFQGLDI